MSQNLCLKVGNRQYYALTGVVVYTSLADSGHYTAYFLSSQQKQWFHANDSLVCEEYIREQINAQFRILSLLQQVTPVSITTVLQQDPYLLIYQLQGKCYVV